MVLRCPFLLSDPLGGFGQVCYGNVCADRCRLVVVPLHVDGFHPGAPRRFDVTPSVPDAGAARKIEESMTYPGQIRVTVIRETRATELAK